MGRADLHRDGRLGLSRTRRWPTALCEVHGCREGGLEAGGGNGEEQAPDSRGSEWRGLTMYLPVQQWASTSICERTWRPEWGETLTVMLHGGSAELEIALWDDDESDGSEGLCLGDAIIDLGGENVHGGVYELTQSRPGGRHVVVRQGPSL